MTLRSFEGWQHPCYARLLEGYGLERAMDLLKWKLMVDDRERVMPIIFELAEKLEPEHGIRLRHMRKRHIDAEVRRFLEVYNAAWQRNCGFAPPTDAEVDDFARELRPVLDENWAMVAERDGETVGAALTLPDYNQVLRHLDGRLLPTGWITALRLRRRIDRVRVFALGVKPQYSTPAWPPPSTPSTSGWLRSRRRRAARWDGSSRPTRP